MPVKPGEELGFVQVLRNAGLFPLPVGLHTRHPGRRYATPFLAVPASPSAPANRTLPSAPAKLHFSSIRVLDSGGNATATPLVGQSYTLMADIANLGSGASYAGIAEFYVGTPASFDQSAVGRTVRRAHGYMGFVAMPNSVVPVACPVPWIPSSPIDVTSSVLVQVSDLCFDPLVALFNARTDRHVGRLDLADFSGRWAGRLAGINVPDEGDVTFGIAQDALTISVSTTAFRNTPLLVGPVDRGRVIVNRVISDQEGEVWAFTLKSVDILHVRIESVTSSGPATWEGDMRRVN